MGTRIIAGLLACLLSSAVPAQVILDLADLVGGGDGTGTGVVQGIDPVDGSIESGERGFNNGPAAFSPVPSLPFVDGVFLPATGPTQLDSAGHVAELAVASGRGWDYIANRRNSQVGESIADDGTNYSRDGRSQIGFHSNKGISFDLAALRSAHPELPFRRFVTTAGMALTTATNGASFLVFLDGQLVSENRDLGPTNSARVDVPLPPSARFLTLVSLDDGDVRFDHVFLGDPWLLPPSTSRAGILAPALPARAARFGTAMASAGDLVAVGSPGANDGRGAIDLFRRSGPLLIHDSRIDPPAGFTAPGFGFSIALAEGELVAGAMPAAVRKGQGGLQVAVLERLGMDWRSKATLQPDAGNDSEFGFTVAIDGGFVAVGAPGDDSNAGQGTGALYLFDTSGRRVDKQGPAGAGTDQRFGSAVAMDSGKLVAGSPGSQLGAALGGVATLYERVGSNLGVVGTLAPPTAGNAGFGRAIALAGDRILLGAPGDVAEAIPGGVAYLCSFSGFDQGFEQVTPAGEQAGAGFGSSVALGPAGTFAVGAPGFGDRGQAFLFAPGTAGLRETPIDGPGTAELGSALAFVGPSLLAGAPGSGDGIGLAVVARDPDIVFDAGGFEDPL